MPAPGAALAFAPRGAPGPASAPRGEDAPRPRTAARTRLSAHLSPRRIARARVPALERTQRRIRFFVRARRRGCHVAQTSARRASAREKRRGSGRVAPAESARASPPGTRASPPLPPFGPRARSLEARAPGTSRRASPRFRVPRDEARLPTKAPHPSPPGSGARLPGGAPTRARARARARGARRPGSPLPRASPPRPPRSAPRIRQPRRGSVPDPDVPGLGSRHRPTRLRSTRLVSRGARRIRFRAAPSPSVSVSGSVSVSVSRPCRGPRGATSSTPRPPARSAA